MVRNIRPCCLVLVISLCMFAWTGQAGSTSNVFRDPDYNLEFRYPTNWRPIETRHQETRISVASDYGNGPDSCNLNVVSNELFEGMSPGQYVQEMMELDFEEHYEQRFDGEFEILKKYSEDISLQPGIRIVSRWSYGNNVVIQEQASLTWQARTYTITCMTPAHRYSELQPIFNAFFGLFAIYE